MIFVLIRYRKGYFIKRDETVKTFVWRYTYGQRITEEDVRDAYQCIYTDNGYILQDTSHTYNLPLLTYIFYRTSIQWNNKTDYICGCDDIASYCNMIKFVENTTELDCVIYKQ